MADAKHTPTPWLMEIDKGMGGPVTIVRNAAGKEVLAMYGAPKDIEHALVAANSHDDLLEALKVMTEHYVRLAGSGDCGNWNPSEEDEVIQARAAIAKATS